ncbi:MAG TPA: hypothetical protein VEK76_00725 [Candidatus Binatia bacterium]|nr:hypothetical protein [Candidatus Binatia bacterium]
MGALILAGGVGTISALLTKGSPASSSTNGGQTGSPSSSPSPSPQSSAAAQAQALYRQVVAASEQSIGFHYVDVSTQSSPGGAAFTETITGDAGQSQGTQQITLSATPADCGNEQFTLILTSDGTVYFQGNSAALKDQVGVSSASLNGKWIQVQIGEGPYQQLEVGITVASQLQEDTFIPSSVQQVTGSGGVSLTRINGTIPATQDSPPAAAYFEVTTGSTLPVSFVSTVNLDNVTSRMTSTFTKWGTAPSVSAPASSTGWSALGASPPASGSYGGGCTSPTAGPSPTPSPGSGGGL